MFVTGCALPHDRDNEKAYVTVNDKTCWTKTLAASDGSQQCGGSHKWHEDSVAVRCVAESVAGKLTVRVYANLDGGLSDESFAIDNVVVKISSGSGTVVRLALRYSVFVARPCECSGVTMSPRCIANYAVHA